MEHIEYTKFTIERRFATNTKTRNAFYQTFFIFGSSPKSGSLGVAFTHYGKLIGASRNPIHHRPITTGTLKPVNFDHSALNRTMATKLSGDYVRVDSEEDTQTTTDEGAFRIMLTEIFGATMREKILINMAMRPGEEPSESVEIDAPTPKPVREDSLLESVIASELDPERLDNRGSW